MQYPKKLSISLFNFKVEGLIWAILNFQYYLMAAEIWAPSAPALFHPLFGEILYFFDKRRLNFAGKPTTERI